MTENKNVAGKTIVIACKYLFGLVGGAERNVAELANFLAEAGAKVFVVVCEERDGVPAFRFDARVAIVNARRQGASKAAPTEKELAAEEFKRAQYSGSDEALNWYNSTFAMRLSWERAIRALSPSLIITFMPHTSTYVLEQLGNEFPVLVTNQNRPKEDYFNPLRHDPSPFDRKKRIENLSFARAIHVLIPEFVEEFPNHLVTKTHVIPNSVPPQPLSQAKGGDKIIVAMGRLVPQKGFDLLIDAMRLVTTEEPDWRLYLYGRGSELETLRVKIRRASLQRNVILRGRTGRPLEALAEADVFVIPSIYEGWGLTLTEAMSLGIPSIGFADCSGVNWLLKDPSCGRLVSERNAQSLAAAILDLIRDDKLRGRLGRSGREHVAQFCPTNVQKRWHQVIGSLLD